MDIFTKCGFHNASKDVFGHFGTVSPLSIFFINQPLFLKIKLSLYIQISNIYLGLGFEFVPQKIRDLAIM